MKIQDLIESTNVPPALLAIRLADSMPESWNRMTLDEVLDLIGEAKKNQKQSFAPTLDTPDIVVDRGPEFQQTKERYPTIIGRYNDWLRAKLIAPMELIGYDKPFVSKSPYSGLMHAHMDDDVSVVYKLTGRNPRHLKVYGFYSHEDLGTTKPPKQKVQQTVGKRLQAQVFQQ